MGTHLEYKMLASDWLLITAANQKPAFCIRSRFKRLEKCWSRPKKCGRRSRANQKPAFRRRCFFGSKNDCIGIKIVGECLDIHHLESQILWHQQGACPPQQPPYSSDRVKVQLPTISLTFSFYTSSCCEKDQNSNIKMTVEHSVTDPHSINTYTKGVK